MGRRVVPEEPKMESVERLTTVEDYLQRWQRLKAQNKPATIDDLSADVKEDPDEVRERIQAVASMMAFLGLGAEAEPTDTVDVRPSVRGVLETLAGGIGSVSRVLLRDTDGGPEPPRVRPNGGDDSSCGTRFRIDGEIARGGMGSVLKGRDPDLGRDVALKVLREDLRDNGDMVRRFVEEAQIGGQLQHPGIVPIYEMGTFDDRRPFFSMKLVKGDTLAKLLAGRQNPGEGLPRFLSIFESIAQTIAYTHARGVIHRDLKPSNVMVGSFGEVQVMDWGLAKVLPRGGIVDDDAAGKIPKDETVIATARSGSGDSDLSRAGSILGTPSYMAPEQARGELDRVNERADVFALGAILCEILTGQPAFLGRTSGELQRKSALGDLAEAFVRLDASGADADLIALAKHCLAREPEDRPNAAGVVSERVTAYLTGVQERLRRAEITTVEERARRRLTTVAAAAVILLSLFGAGGYAWDQQQKANRMAKTSRAVDEALADAARLRGEALSAPASDTGRWAAAVTAAKRAEGLLAQGDADGALKVRVDTLMAGVERERAAAAEKARQVEIDRVLLAELESVRGNRVAHLNLKRTDAEYADVFRKAGLDLDATKPEESGKWLESRTDPIELAGYLDDWAFIRKATGRPESDWRRLVAAARGGDPDPWRDAVRAKFGSNDAGAIVEFGSMAVSPQLEDRPVPGLLLLARQLKFGCGDGARAAHVLRRAARRYPGDFRLHLELALALGETLESYRSLKDTFLNPDEAVRHLTAAAAIRPGSVSTHVVLGMALTAQLKHDEAVAECREAIRLKPDDVSAHTNLGNALRWRGKLAEAAAECRKAIWLKPDDAFSHSILGVILKTQARNEEAIPEFREALRLKPDYSNAALDLAQVLQFTGDYAGALAVVRELKEHGVAPTADPWHSEEWLAAVEPLAALEARLPAILKGNDRPKDVAERLDLAQMCYNKKLFAAAARYWGEALDEDSKVGNDRRLQHRYNAACSAALTASGQSKDEPPLDVGAKASLRIRARDWLRAELAAWSRLLQSGPPTARPTIVFTMQHWRRDVDLAAVRDAAALAKVPEAERKEWQAIWEEVDALIRKASDAKPG
jgi:eukaryotic-like serine/threonine-protein kinase